MGHRRHLILVADIVLHPGPGQRRDRRLRSVEPRLHQHVGGGRLVEAGWIDLIYDLGVYVRFQLRSSEVHAACFKTAHQPEEN